MRAHNKALCVQPSHLSSTTFVNPNESETLHSQRDLFDLPDEVVFLNCANMSPQLRAVTDAGIEAVQQKKAPWKTSAPDWFTGAEALRAAAARLMGADADGVGLYPPAALAVEPGR